MEYTHQTILSDIEGLNPRSIAKLNASGFHKLVDFQGIFFPNVYDSLSFEQAKTLLSALKRSGIQIEFKRPNLSEEGWKEFLEELVSDGIVSWKDISILTCGELNPPQVGTAIASSPSFQAKFPPKKTMKNVIEWFYSQNGKCAECGSRLCLEADHIVSKEAFINKGMEVSDADVLTNLQLLCKRCNVIKRPSHLLGGISFAPAQSVLMWILLREKPKTKQDFYSICRQYGLTMANIRFDEAWAFAVWLHKEGKYSIEDASI